MIIINIIVVVFPVIDNIDPIGTCTALAAYPHFVLLHSIITLFKIL